LPKPPTNEPQLFPNLRSIAQTDLPEPLALLIFTQRLAALKQANVAMPRILAILQDSPAPYGVASEYLRGEIERGNAICGARSAEERQEKRDSWWHPRSLFQPMSARPELFSCTYVAMVRAGEYAGAVDETLRSLRNE